MVTAEILLDQNDLEAMARDLADVFATYGTEKDCPPHLLRVRASAIERVRQTFLECVMAANV